jgi:hypothetical protein
MITFVDLLAFVVFVTVSIIALALGQHLAGIPGAVIGVAIGGFVSYFISRKLHFFLLQVSLGPTIRELSRLSLDELQWRLNEPICPLNLILLELKRRNEDMRQYLPLVVAYLTSETQHRRVFGLAALYSAYPELSSNIRGYRLRDSVEECQKKTATLLSAELN